MKKPPRRLFFLALAAALCLAACSDGGSDDGTTAEAAYIKKSYTESGSTRDAYLFKTKDDIITCFDGIYAAAYPGTTCPYSVAAVLDKGLVGSMGVGTEMADQLDLKGASYSYVLLLYSQAIIAIIKISDIDFSNPETDGSGNVSYPCKGYTNFD